MLRRPTSRIIALDSGRAQLDHGRMLIRTAQPADAPAIAALYHELVSNPKVTVDPRQLAEIAADPRNFLLLAHESSSQDHDGTAGPLLGTVFMTICPDPMFAARYALIEYVVVTASARNQRVGARLLEHAEDIARREQCTRIMLLSTARRTDAHRFFTRAGFDGERKRGFVKYLTA